MLNTGNVHYCMVYADRYIFARIVQAVVVKFGKCFLVTAESFCLLFHCILLFPVEKIGSFRCFWL